MLTSTVIGAGAVLAPSEVGAAVVASVLARAGRI